MAVHRAGALFHVSLVATSIIDRPAEVRLLDLRGIGVASPSGAFERSVALVRAPAVRSRQAELDPAFDMNAATIFGRRILTAATHRW